MESIKIAPEDKIRKMEEKLEFGKTHLCPVQKYSCTAIMPQAMPAGTMLLFTLPAGKVVLVYSPARAIAKGKIGRKVEVNE